MAAESQLKVMVCVPGDNSMHHVWKYLYAFSVHILHYSLVDHNPTSACSSQMMIALKQIATDIVVLCPWILCQLPSHGIIHWTASYISTKIPVWYYFSYIYTMIHIYANVSIALKRVWHSPFWLLDATWNKHHIVYLQITFNCNLVLRFVFYIFRISLENLISKIGLSYLWWYTHCIIIFKIRQWIYSLVRWYSIPFWANNDALLLLVVTVWKRNANMISLFLCNTYICIPIACQSDASDNFIPSYHVHAFLCGIQLHLCAHDLVSAESFEDCFYKIAIRCHPCYTSGTHIPAWSLITLISFWGLFLNGRHHVPSLHHIMYTHSFVTINYIYAHTQTYVSHSLVRIFCKKITITCRPCTCHLPPAHGMCNQTSVNFLNS